MENVLRVCLAFKKLFLSRVSLQQQGGKSRQAFYLYGNWLCVNWNVINKTRFEMCRMPHRTVLSFLNRKKARLYREALCVWAIWASIRWWCLTFSFCAKKITMKVLRRLLFFPQRLCKWLHGKCKIKYNVIDQMQPHANANMYKRINA